MNITHPKLKYAPGPMKAEDARFLAILIAHQEPGQHGLVVPLARFRDLCINVYAITARPATCTEAMLRLEQRGFISIHVPRSRSCRMLGRVIVLNPISRADLALALGIPWAELGEILITGDRTKLREALAEKHRGTARMKVSKNIGSYLRHEQQATKSMEQPGVPGQTCSYDPVRRGESKELINPEASIVERGSSPDDVRKREGLDRLSSRTRNIISRYKDMQQDDQGGRQTELPLENVIE